MIWLVRTMGVWEDVYKRQVPAAERLILSIILNFIADDMVLCILDRLADNVLAAHRLSSCLCRSPRAIS